MRGTRLAIVVSHPIQHFVHFYRALAKQPELTVKVFFCSRIGLEEYFDSDMGTMIRWADDMTGGFDHEFLPEAEDIKDTRFRSINNPSVTRSLKAFGPDAVMIYGYAQITPLRALAWCRAHGVPVLMTTDSNAVTQRSPLKTVLRQVVLRFLFSQVSGFLTVGDQNEAVLERFGVPKRRMYRSPFTIDETRYRRARDERAVHRTAIRSKYGIAEEAFVGIAVGKLIPRKRMEDAVLAFVQVAEKLAGRAPAHLLVCGNGPDLESLRRLVRVHSAPVALAGFINVDRLPDYFCAADVLVHPAGRDAHPLICSEAACVGLPMILSDLVGTMGPTDISRDGENALVYTCGDLGALANSVVRLTIDRQLLADMSAASLRVFEECGLSASVEGLLRAVRSVTSREVR